MQKNLLILAVVALVLIGGVFLVWEKKNRLVSNEKPNQSQTNVATPEENSVFVTDIDLDVSHWQIKETENFLIKFPKEWYWLESDLKATGYHSIVITNNPDFPISEYPDIAIGTGGNYPLAIRNDSEIVISTNGLGWVTTDEGSPRDFLEFEMDRVRNVNSSAECSYISNLKDTPLIAKCSYTDASSAHKVITYYSAETNRTFAYSARMTEKNNLNMEPILEHIVKSFQLKEGNEK